MLANHVFRRLMLFSTHLLLLLQPSVLWLSIVTFNNDAKPPPRRILREFDVLRTRPQLSGLLHLETFTWQNLTPAERVTWSGRPGYPPWGVTPTYHVNVIKLEWEIIWTGRLPHLNGLSHLPGVPHLHVNRPYPGKREGHSLVCWRERKKGNGFVKQNNNFLHVHHALLYISLSSLRDYHVQMLDSRFIDDVNKRPRIFLSLP